MITPHHRAPRYSVRTALDEGPRGTGRTEEVGITADLEQAVDWAWERHRQTGAQVWIWDVATGATLYRIKRDPVKAAKAGGGV